MKPVKPFTSAELEEWAKDAMEQGGPYPSPKLLVTVGALEEARYALDAYKAMHVIQESTIDVLKKELAKAKRQLRKYERVSRGTI